MVTVTIDHNFMNHASNYKQKERNQYNINEHAINGKAPAESFGFVGYGKFDSFLILVCDFISDR